MIFIERSDEAIKGSTQIPFSPQGHPKTKATATVWEEQMIKYCYLPSAVERWLDREQTEHKLTEAKEIFFFTGPHPHQEQDLEHFLHMMTQGRVVA